MIDKPPDTRNMICHRIIMDALIRRDDNIAYAQTYLVFKNDDLNKPPCTVQCYDDFNLQMMI